MLLVSCAFDIDNVKTSKTSIYRLLLFPQYYVIIGS